MTSTTSEPYVPFYRRVFRRAFWFRVLFVVVALLTAIALGYAIENWRGHRAWKDAKKKLTRTGFIELAALVPPPVPDAQNFAMTPFLKPLFDFLPGTQKWRNREAVERTLKFGTGFPKLDLWGGFPTGKEIDLRKYAAELSKESSWKGDRGAVGEETREMAAREILKEMSRLNPILDELRTASRRLYARFNIRYDNPNAAGVLLPHLAVLKQAAEILTVQAIAELALGKSEEAFENVSFILYLADSIHREPTLIGHLVRIALFKMAAQVVWEGEAGGRWSEAQYLKMQERFSKFDFVQDLERAFRGEQAFGNSLIEYLKIHRDRDEFESMFDVGRDFSSRELAFRFAPRGWLELEQVNYHRLFQPLFGICDVSERRVFPGRAHQIQQETERTLTQPGAFWQHRLFAGAMIPAVVNGAQRFAYSQTLADQIVTMGALERCRAKTGGYPETLDLLTPEFLKKIPHDVCDGKPLRYRRKSENAFVLYSVGWNESDDGGIPPPIKRSSSSSPRLDEGDWVWQSDVHSE